MVDGLVDSSLVQSPTVTYDVCVTTAADTVRPLLLGTLSADEWAPIGEGDDSEPWVSFAQARFDYGKGRQGEAIERWRRIASMPGIESRQSLQAWHFLRTVGVRTPESVGRQLLGAVAELPVRDGHDLLAGYSDGSVRYVNFSGRAAVVEDRTIITVQEALSGWLEVARTVVQSLGPWEGSELPDLPVGSGRIMMLTPSGIHFGQAPAEALMADPRARAFLEAATRLLKIVVGISA